MNKKAQWSDIRKALLTVIILAIIVGYLIMRFILNPSSSIQTGVISPQAKEMCKAEMDKQYPPADADADGFPDHVQRLGFACDLCWSKIPGKGNDNIDNDGDLIPAECDSDDNKPMDSKSSFKSECEERSGHWNDELKRCAI